LSEHERGLVLRIGAGARRMAGMVEGLLSLSRIGRQSIRKSVVRVESIVRESVEELRRTSSPRYVEVVWDRLPDCLGDESLVKQAFFNLLSNAFKYTGKVDHPVIRISFEAAAGEGIYSVRDNGVGFDMRYEGRLFGVFQRLHDPGDFEGMGVGLSIVQRIVHRHGGRIWAEGEVGKGAAFHFTLPGG
jgi:signal transduction histidine kinase